MTGRVEQIKKLILVMTDEEMEELNQWIYECFKHGNEAITWDDAVDQVSNRLKGLSGKPN